jgi:hypothetical protein
MKAGCVITAREMRAELSQSNQLHYRAHMKTENYAQLTKAPSTAGTITQADMRCSEYRLSDSLYLDVAHLTASVIFFLVISSIKHCLLRYPLLREQPTET